MSVDSQAVLYSEGKNDECYTPAYAVRPLLEFLPSDWVVWAPFDTEASQFVQVLGERNRVICSHIAQGQDFYEYEPTEHWDALISNPPFTRKRQIFERALSFGKPIALLMSMVWLNDKYSGWVFYEAGRQMQLLKFDKRIYYEVNGVTRTDITFASGYYCSDFLPRDIVLRKLRRDGQIELPL